jgi:aconitase A
MNDFTTTSCKKNLAKKLGASVAAHFLARISSNTYGAPCCKLARGGHGRWWRAQGGQEDGAAAPNRPCEGVSLVEPTRRWRAWGSKEETRGGGGGFYSAVAKLTSGGGDDAKMGVEGRERAHARIKILAVGSSCACRFIPRVATNAQDLAPRIGQNHPHTKFFTAPARIERLLEDRNSTQALYTNGFYSAGTICSDCWRCSQSMFYSMSCYL